jgi:serine/threonine kinase 38
MIWNELNSKMGSLNLSEPEKQMIKQDIFRKEAINMRSMRRRTSVFDFESIAIIGKGAFGEVRVVRNKITGEIQAMKKMSKQEMIRKNQITHVRSERNVLAFADNPWIVELKSSFQDDSSLYLVMEYLPGGDLMNILMKRDILPEDEARFYIAELVLSVESVHKMSYIHRDLKPDNVLIDRTGHIKLSDFGLCKQANLTGDSFILKKNNEDEASVSSTKHSEYKRSRILAFSTVGTPDYIAPEVFNKQGYNETADWWSVGVILYEMVVGYPPFFADDPSLTCQKILHWKKTLNIPREAGLSREVTDLIKKLICDPNERLGSRGAQEIKNHPFFKGINWEKIRETRAPWMPKLQNEFDTSNFDKFEENEPFHPQVKRKHKKDSNFTGYTFKKSEENYRNNLVEALKELDNIKLQPHRKASVPLRF